MNPRHRGVDARALPSPKGQPMAFPFKAVIFDMDGVIVDTEKFYFDELAVMSEELGLGITEEERKRQEKHQATVAEAMEAVPKSFPALMRSAKVQNKAAHVGFDWDDPRDALKKVSEESQELLQAMDEADPAHMDEEAGDLLFAAVNVIRLLKRDPELLLHKATDKFMRRFSTMEVIILSQDKKMENMTLAEMDAYWDLAKKGS